ncbi:MAG: hypothetical protein JWM04_1015, partial [Verrucomicrobiales bacterium]|nr:hypothetical protein [Verrucomicrobiales bacterium]
IVFEVGIVAGIQGVKLANGVCIAPRKLHRAPIGFRKNPEGFVETAPEIPGGNRDGANPNKSWIQHGKLRLKTIGKENQSKQEYRGMQHDTQSLRKNSITSHFLIYSSRPRDSQLRAPPVPVLPLGRIIQINDSIKSKFRQFEKSIS